MHNYDVERVGDLKEMIFINNIAAIVVTYNRKELLKECIQKLINQTYNTFDILIIDNHSTDGTYEEISDFLDRPRIKYYDTGSNLGGAGGFQFGLKMAVEQGYEYVWLMDDDSMPTETALEELVVAYEDLGGDAGFLSSKVVWVDGEICNMNIQRATATKRVNDFSREVIPVAVASFVSLFVPSKIVKNVGLPFKEFFIWTDDWEYTRRISKKFPCYLITKSVVIHKTASNTGSNIALDSDDRLERYKYAYRNEMFFFKREGIKGLGYYFAKLALHGYRVLRFSPDKKKKRLSIIYSNAREGIKFNPVIEYPKEDLIEGKHESN